MLELRHLKSLVAIAETSKLSEAAERVHLTQSALSHQVRALEHHYGITLFERTAAGLRFTPAGQRLLSLARELLALVRDAERDLHRLKNDAGGELRIALECHTCFDWLLPVMNEFRRRWPEVEVDLVAGFHSDPMKLLQAGRAEVVIGSLAPRGRAWRVKPLFRFEILAVLPIEHRMRGKRYVEAADLLGETLVTYPVAEDRIDLIREVLKPAGVRLQRRTAELTVAIVQLVASRRGIAALPNWGLKNYLELGYVIGKRIGRSGLWSELHAIATPGVAAKPYFEELAAIIRERCAADLDGITLL